jgi:hypothetical protein
MAFAFDTLAYVRRLRDGGVPAPVAEVHAEATREFVITELVTKSDLDGVRRELETSISTHVDRLETSIAHHVDRLETAIATFRQETKDAIAALRQETRDSIANFRREMGAAMKSLEDRIMVQMGFMFAAAIAILAAIIKL